MKFVALMAAMLMASSLPAFADTATNSDSPNLDALDVEPNQLYGIDGLHSGRVPLGAISPATLKTFVQAVDLMRREYIEPIDDEALFYYAINGMLNRVDRNAEFLDANAFANLNSFTEGNVASVGLKAVWRASDAHWVVTEVLTDSPAKIVGITAGDYLHQIGDIKLNQSQSENDIVQLLNGISGSSVDVTYSKAGRSKRTVNLIRNQLEKSSIEVLVQNNIAIIKLPVFQNNTRQEILNHLSAITTPVQGVVLDLRNNPGGVLDAAVDVASLFMRKQVVTQVQNRTGIERVLETQGSPILESVPVVILQNRYSASAAEVLASALQTHERALIVGETSYGKGSVQSVIPIGIHQGIKLTTAHYLTPTGAEIDKIGVVPDVSFERESMAGDDTWLKLSLELVEQAKSRAASQHSEDAVK
ncbi:S41 family peptidase [Moraxella marmotae]|uniref:S41 family peptidase n=1 Tax=Moraxella marmotae TaxID=3344520 RepID=UPI0035F251F3